MSGSPVDQPQPAEASGEDQINYEFSSVNTSEKFVELIIRLLQNFQDEKLLNMLKTATTNWAGFQPASIGIKLPLELSGTDINALSEEAPLRDVASARHLLFTLAATELLLRQIRMLFDLSNVPSSDSQFGQNNQALIAHATKVHELAPILMSGLVNDSKYGLREQVVAQLAEKYGVNLGNVERNTNTFLNKEADNVLDILGLSKRTVDENVGSLSAADPDRRAKILAALEHLFTNIDIAKRLDVSVTGTALLKNLSVYEADQSKWKEKMTEFVRIYQQ